MRISYSLLDTYQTCPLKYKFKEIDKRKEPKSKEQVFGTLLHSVMQYIHTPGFASPTLEQALDFYSKNWSSEFFKEEVEERSAFSQGVDMIQKYYAKNDVSSATIVDLESRFEIELLNPEDPDEIHVVSGIIDRIDKTDTGYEIIDYKTARKMPTQDKIDTDLQLSIYLKAFLKRYPKEIHNLENITVSLYFLKHGVKLSATRTKEQLQKVDETFLEVIKKIEDKQFDPNLTPLCEWCGFQKECPMWRHQFKEERKIDTDEVNQTIDTYIALKNKASEDRKKMAELQKTIATYMDQEGVERVFGTEKIIERTIRKTYSYNAEELEKLLTPIGRWKDVIKVDGTALKKVIGELPFALKKDVENTRQIDRETKSLTVKKK